MPQKHKGERVMTGVRLPIAYTHKLNRWVEATGQSRQDLLERLTCDFLDEADPAFETKGQQALELEGQEEIPMQNTT